jgi:wobble nucleotide-excising tRNase
VSGYIKEKLQEKQKIDDEINQANAILEGKNVSIEAINEYIQLNEKLNEYNLSFHDTAKLLNVLVNAKENGFDGKKNCGEAA